MCPLALMFVNVVPAGMFVNPEPSPTKAFAITVPLALILPEAVMC